jgi:hypothetical protein
VAGSEENRVMTMLEHRTICRTRLVPDLCPAERDGRRGSAFLSDALMTSWPEIDQINLLRVMIAAQRISVREAAQLSLIMFRQASQPLNYHRAKTGCSCGLEAQPSPLPKVATLNEGFL